MGRTLLQKMWDSHRVRELLDGRTQEHIIPTKKLLRPFAVLTIAISGGVRAAPPVAQCLMSPVMVAVAAVAGCVASAQEVFGYA